MKVETKLTLLSVARCIFYRVFHFLMAFTIIEKSKLEFDEISGSARGRRKNGDLQRFINSIYSNSMKIGLFFFLADPICCKYKSPSDIHRHSQSAAAGPRANDEVDANVMSLAEHYILSYSCWLWSLLSLSCLRCRRRRRRHLRRHQRPFT